MKWPDTIQKSDKKRFVSKWLKIEQAIFISNFK